MNFPFATFRCEKKIALHWPFRRLRSSISFIRAITRIKPKSFPSTLLGVQIDDAGFRLARTTASHAFLANYRCERRVDLSTSIDADARLRLNYTSIRPNCGAQLVRRCARCGTIRDVSHSMAEFRISTIFSRADIFLRFYSYEKRRVEVGGWRRTHLSTYYIENDYSEFRIPLSRQFQAESNWCFHFRSLSSSLTLRSDVPSSRVFRVIFQRVVPNELPSWMFYGLNWGGAF